MLDIPVIRWGKDYESLEKTEIVHFADGQPIATVSQANGGLVTRDMRKAAAVLKCFTGLRLRMNMVTGTVQLNFWKKSIMFWDLTEERL